MSLKDNIEKGFNKPMDNLEGFGLPKEWFMGILIVGVIIGILLAIPGMMNVALSFLFASAPFWVPIALLVAAWSTWIWYIRAKFIANQEHTLLEVKIPREISKSPKAMEAVFAGLHVGLGETTFINRWIEGKVRNWFSFELTSIEGRIHFHVWTRSFFKELVEAQIYAQYPDVEIFEVEDYALRHQYNPNTHSYWGCNFKLTGKDPYPIKTYVDYGLDKDPKEEFKVDPIAHLFEYLSALGKGEQVWIQVIARTNKDKRRKEGKLFETESRWKGEAEDEIKEITDKATMKKKDKEGKEEAIGPPSFSPSQKQKVEAIERSIDKTGFDTGIRGVYVAEKDSFKGIRVVGMTGIFKQFSSAHLNGIAPFGELLDIAYPWQKWGNAEANAKAGIFDAYRRRSWYHPPYREQHYVMTTEELATVYHYPSSIIAAPGLERIPAKKAEAPPNLPV